jgi:DNA-binding NarL/FixJ family response regulator
MISVFIADDHYMVIEGIRALLQQEADIELIGHASNAFSCRAFLKQAQPDVLLLDINLPDESGIELCREFQERYPAMMILALTTFNQETIIRKMLDSGAMGYLLKNVTREELCEAIHVVYKRQSFLSHDIAQTLKHSALNASDAPVLTRREKEVLELIAEGMTTQEMADQLFISPATVDTHRKNLLTKLNAKNTASLVKLAVMYDLITIRDPRE